MGSPSHMPTGPLLPRPMHEAVRIPHSPSLIALLISFALTVSAGAETPPSIRGAKFVPAPPSSSFATGVESLLKSAADGEWIGYAVKPLRNNTVCSDTWTNGHFAPARLEHDDDGMSTTSYDEGDDGFYVERDLYVLMHVKSHRFDKMRLFTSDCDVKASGSTIHWIGNVSPAESVALLTDIATRTASGKRERENLHERAVCAIALHDAPEGLRTLQTVYENSEDAELRSNLVFWIGQTGRKEGVEFLHGALHKDPSAEVREQIIFAISQDESQYAVDALIDIARHDSNPDLREKAIFWLSQKASDKAGETLRDAASDDPDQDVKEQAVFALSQLPPEQGIPLLIDVARKNADPEIREKAIFWLGQSDDPRVITFFEEVLSK